MSLLAKIKRPPKNWKLRKGFEATSRWLESTLEVARWENVVRAGRRWGWWGAALGALLGVLCFAPAAWMADWVTNRTNGRLVLAEAQGTVWTGDAVAVLTGGEGSRDARALPGRLGWRLRPNGLGVQLEISQDCCLPQPMRLDVKPGWGRVGVRLTTAQGPDVTGRWPAAWLGGLGTPWNTLELSGMMRFQAHDLHLEWVQGRLRVQGQADIALQDVASRVTTLDRLGTYRLSVLGDDQGQVALNLYTEDGPLQLSGTGSVGPLGVRFRGEARAAETEQGALNNLLNIIGRREGDRSVISIG